MMHRAVISVIAALLLLSLGAPKRVTYALAGEDICDLVDCERYPLTDLEGERARALISDARQAWQATGYVELVGFIRAERLAALTREVSGLESYHRLNEVGVYATRQRPAHLATDAQVAALPLEHPMRRTFAQNTFAVANDQIPASAQLRRVYRNALVLRLLSAIRHSKRGAVPASATSPSATPSPAPQPLYPFEDEFQSLNVMYMPEGCNRAWHYDGSDLVVTLMLQRPEAGGEFEFAPFIRGTGSTADFARIAGVMDGTHETVLTSAAAGTLTLFNGETSLHRVRTVHGAQTRIIAVLSYDTQPGRVGLPFTNVFLYGERVAEIYAQRGVAIEDVDTRLVAQGSAEDAALQYQQRQGEGRLHDEV